MLTITQATSNKKTKDLSGKQNKKGVNQNQVRSSGKKKLKK
jgi:hypothetical protein